MGSRFGSKVHSLVQWADDAGFYHLAAHDVVEHVYVFVPQRRLGLATRFWHVSHMLLWGQCERDRVQ